MDGTVSGTFGSIFSRLDQWSTWGKLALGGLAFAFLRLNWWLLGIAFSKHHPDNERQRSVIALFVIWAIVIGVAVVADS